MRRVAGVALAAAALLGLNGCALVPTACPAIAWSSTASISLAQPRPGLTLQLCTGEGCEPGGSDSGVIGITGSSEGGWSTSVPFAPPVLGYRLRDAAAAVVDEGYVPVEWRRVGGDERCGGPAEATVTL